MKGKKEVEEIITQVNNILSKKLLQTDSSKPSQEEIINHAITEYAWAFFSDRLEIDFDGKKIYQRASGRL